MKPPASLTPEQSALISESSCFQGLLALGNERLFPISLFLGDKMRFDALDAAWGTDQFLEAVGAASMLGDGDLALPPAAFAELVRLAESWNSPPPPQEPKSSPSTQPAPRSAYLDMEDLTLPEAAFAPFPFIAPPAPSIGFSAAYDCKHDPLPSHIAEPKPSEPQIPAPERILAHIHCPPLEHRLPDIDLVEPTYGSTYPAGVQAAALPHHDGQLPDIAEELHDATALAPSGLPDIDFDADTPSLKQEQPTSISPTPSPLPAPLAAIAPPLARPAPPASDPKACIAAIERRDIYSLAKAIPKGSIWPPGQTWSPASYCAYCDWPQGLLGCIAAGHSLDALDSNGISPIAWAAGRKAWGALAALLENGASLAPLERKPLAILAITQGATPQLLRKALARGADPNACDPSGFSAIHLASAKGLRDHCDVLIEGGARLDLPSPDGMLPRDAARAAKHLELAHHLQRQAIRSRAQKTSAPLPSKPETPLPQAAPIASPSLGINTVSTPSLRPAPPSRATLSPKSPLASSPPSSSQKKAEGDPFERAAKLFDIKALSMSLRLRRPAGDAAAALCSAASWIEGLRACVQAGRPFDDPDSQGARPIHAAALAQSFDCLTELLALGAAPDSQLSDGRTALHICALSGWTLGCEALLEAKARLDLLDLNGKSPRDLAKHAGHAELSAILARAKFQERSR